MAEREKVKKISKKIVKKISTKKKTVKKVTKKVLVKLKKSLHNPIIGPRLYAWESKATFNPTAFLANGRVSLIYRAIGDTDSSVLGYAGSADGYHIDERLPHAVFERLNNFSRDSFSSSPINYISGGGWNGGCEDPRTTLLDNTVYMLYTAFDGWGSLRIALTSIKLDDFEKKRWKWKNPVLISPVNEIHKNWVLFPEKIKGKFAILHSISPNIMIDYFDSLDELNGNKFIHSIHNRDALWASSNKFVRGAGPAPIKTKDGWLVLYHAIEKNDSNKYKLFAMILDAKNPTKVLYDSKYPVLEPETWYENEGYKGGVVYSCGAVVKDETLFVYYGAADKVVGVATIKIAELLEDLKKHKAMKLKKLSTRI